METISLVEAWDQAAGALENDAMRSTRYAMCLRYLTADMARQSRILEVGCGEGSGLSQLQQLGFSKLAGVEVSPERIRRAQSRLDHAVALQLISPTQRLPFDDGAFDAVISAAVIEHAVDVNFFVREIARVVRTGGRVVISSDCYMWRILQQLGIYRSEQPVDRAMFPTKLIRLFTAHGLRTVHADAFPMPGNEYRFLRMLARHWFGRPRQAKPAVRAVQRPTAIPPHWRPRHWIWALPALVFSDENVFFLVKQ